MTFIAVFSFDFHAPGYYNCAMIDVKRVLKYLIKNQMTVSVMESCTGGLISSMITDAEGSSEIFPGGLVTYSNEAKIKEGVPSGVIKEHGVYSGECARHMAMAVKQKMETSIAIGITGIAGNVDPNNEGGSIGEVYFCVIINEKKYDFHIKEDVSKMERHDIKLMYAGAVFERLWEALGGDFDR